LVQLHFALTWPLVFSMSGFVLSVIHRIPNIVHSEQLGLGAELVYG